MGNTGTIGRSLEFGVLVINLYGVWGFCRDTYIDIRTIRTNRVNSIVRSRKNLGIYVPATPSYGSITVYLYKHYKHSTNNKWNLFNTIFGYAE